MASNAHTLHARCHHHGWNNALAPAVRIAPGDTVAFETVDASGGQLGPAATLDDLKRLDFSLVNPVTGPVHVDGAELYLPVEVPGALFSVGDTHAAQGDGEVCGTAIESPMQVTLRFDLVKGAGLRFPRVTLPGPVTRHFDAKGYEVTTGIGPDLMEGARAAVSGMIDLLTARHGMSAVEAYMLCSVCADLRISEIVDAPNWLVSLYLPRIVFD